MWKNISGWLLIALALFVCASPTLAQQEPAENKLVYSLDQACHKIQMLDPAGSGQTIPDPARNKIEVAFGKSFPTDDRDAVDPATGKKRTVVHPPFNFPVVEYEARVGILSPNNWIVRAVELATGAETAIEVLSVLADEENKRAVLTMDRVVQPDLFRYVVIYTQGNTPLATLESCNKKKETKLFTAAKGPKDADIYISGAATGQKKSGPLYSIEAKAGYFKELGRAGFIGGKGTLVSEEGSDVDPDSITLTGSYQKIFVLSPATGILLNSDFLGGEFSRENKARNLISELDGTLVLPSVRLGKSSNFATMDFMAGFEAGHNYRHSLSPNGFGNIWRPKVGANAYIVAMNPRVFNLNRINFTAQYLLRLPRTNEPFTEKINGEKVSSLTKRPRHFAGMDLDLMFAPSYGVSLKYRYGTLPPEFTLVEHKVSIGFTLQLKQANKP